MKDLSLERLINENFIYAKVLHYFGVEYYESRNKTLSEICEEYQISQTKVIDLIERSDQKNEAQQLDLKRLPTSLIIAYLKHSHQLFIKDRMPYLLKLVGQLTSFEEDGLVHDLQVVLPMFVDDFVHHVYEEEAKLFSYIMLLDSFVQGQTSASKVITKVNDFSIQEFSLHHGESDDEMKGIRGITNGYNLDLIHDLKQKVVYQALKSFDDELIKHAIIENEVLFPRAILLEKQAMNKLSKGIELN